MPSRFRRRIRTAALVVAVWTLAAAIVAGAVPDLALPDDRAPRERTRVVGAVHMHTVASDGSGSVDDLVDAAIGNELDFIVVSDHNSQLPTRYEYRRGVLVILAEEYSSPRGHMLLLGMDSVRLGEPDSLDLWAQQTAHRFTEEAQLTFVSHPSGKRPWRDRTLSTVDGIEIWNADSEWRNDGVVDWLEALTLLPFRPELGMLALVDRPAENLALLDSVLPQRASRATCAVDAHARIPITRDVLIPFPSYGLTLALIHQHLSLAEPFTGDAEADAKRVFEALGRGSGHCSIGVLGDARSVRIDVEADASARSREVRVDLPAATRDARIRVYLGGVAAHEEVTNQLRWATREAGPLRVEIDRNVRLVRRRWLPWVVTGSLGDARMDETPKPESPGEP
jgi:hypothetical protein